MFDKSKPLFAFVRAQRMMTIGYLVSQSQHAARTTPTASTRPVAQRGDSVFWSLSGNPADYTSDFREHKAQTGARERKSAALGLHLLLGVSPEWLAEVGDIHDRCNPRVSRLFEEALAFGASIGGMFAARLDLDERGGGVVDVFLAPVHVRQAKLKKDGTRGPGVQEISVKSALSDLQRRVGGGKSFAAAQTLWAAHAAEHLDARIVRGVTATMTGRKHLTVPEFRRAAEEAKENDRRREGEKTLALNTLAFIAEEQGRAQASDKQLVERGKQLEQLEATLESRRAELTEREDVLLVTEYGLQDERDEIALARSTLQARAQTVGKDAAAIVELRLELAAASAALALRERGIIAAEARVIEDRDAIGRRAEAFTMQRDAYESDLNLRRSQLAAALAELDGRRENEDHRTAVERAAFDAQVCATRERDQQRVKELVNRESKIGTAETEVLRRAAIQRAKEEDLEDERKTLKTWNAELSAAASAACAREILTREALEHATSLRNSLERDREDLLEDVGRMASGAMIIEDARPRSRAVRELLAALTSGVQTAVKKHSEQSMIAVEAAKVQERVASERLAATDVRHRELEQLGVTLQRRNADMNNRQAALSRDQSLVRDRANRQNAETDALLIGLLAIGRNELDKPEKVAQRVDLTPAAPLLTSIVRTIVMRVEEITQRARDSAAAAERAEQAARAREQAAADGERRWGAVVNAARGLVAVVEKSMPSLPQNVQDAIRSFRNARAARGRAKSDLGIGI